ncbi:MAG: hypothetical protein ACXVXC_10820 [Nocardioidaceae bacterium]
MARAPGPEGRDVEAALRRLDDASATRARGALVELLDATGGLPRVNPRAVRDYLDHVLVGSEVPRTEQHEIVWALGDFFAAADLPALARLCRDQATHERIAAPQPSATRHQRATTWWQGLHRGSEELRAEVLSVLQKEPQAPARLELALTPVRALLDAVGEGITLTGAGYLPPKLALALDNRFGWSDEYALGRPRGETDLPALQFLDQHLREQQLLLASGRTLTAAASSPDASALWQAVVAPGPRWHPGFEQDALAVMAATLLRSPEITRAQLRDEMAYLLSEKWRSTGDRTVDDGVRGVELAWFRVGVTLGWWDRGGGLWSAKVQLSSFGRAAAASVFWAVAGRQR